MDAPKRILAQKRAALVNRSFGAVPLLHLLVIFALILSASGCSKQPATALPVGSTPAAGEKGGAAGEPPAAPGAAPTKLVLEPAGSEAVITFATYSFLESAYKPILEEFHKQYPKITIQVREVPATLDTRLIASAADTTLLFFRPPNGAEHFLDVTPLIEVDPDFAPESFWPGVLEACKDGQGRTYGLPVTIEPTGIYYREQAFASAGVQPPGPGWTWEDFQKAAAALTTTEKGLPVYGYVDDSFIDTPDETLLSPRISFLLDKSGGKIDVKALESELQWYLNLVQSGGIYSANIFPQRSPMLASESAEAWSKAWNGAWSSYHEMFLNHPPAMWKGRLDQVYWSDVDMKALPDGSLNMGAASGPIVESKEGIGWAPFPVSADGHNDQTTPNTVTCGVISAGTRHPRAAWTWLSFLAEHPILPEWSLAVPAKPSAAEASGYWSKIPESWMGSIRYSVEHGWYSNPHPQAVLAVNQALLKAVADKADFQAALVDAGSRIETPALPTPDTAPIVLAPPDPTAMPSETKIDFYSPLFFGADRSKNLVEAFHKLHPDINVQFATSSDIQGAAGLADAFDCFAWLPEKELPSDRLYDLNQFLLVEQADLSKDFVPEAVLDDFSQDGKLFGLPTVYRPNLIYYNADLLAQRGLKPPALGWTYDDFIALISAAASGSGAEQVYGMALEYPTPDLDMFLAGRNIRLVEASGGVPTFHFDTLETRDTLNWLARQVEAGVVFPVTPIQIGKHANNYETARRLILDGRVAFWMSWFDEGHGGAYGLQEAKFSIGAAAVPLPKGTGTWRPNHVVLGQYISRKAENPRACWEWIKFLSEQPDKEYGVPARRSVRESQGWAAQVGPEQAPIYQAALEQRRTRYQQNEFGLGLARDWWNALLAEVVHGADPAPLLDTAQAKADAYTACLAGSTDFKTGTPEQKAQAETACAERANQR